MTQRIMRLTSLYPMRRIHLLAVHFCVLGVCRGRTWPFGGKSCLRLGDLTHRLERVHPPLPRTLMLLAVLAQWAGTGVIVRRWLSSITTDGRRPMYRVC